MREINWKPPIELHDRYEKRIDPMSELNITIENNHLSGELISTALNQIRATVYGHAIEIKKLVDTSTGNMFEGSVDLAGDIYFVNDGIDKTYVFYDEAGRARYFDLYLNSIPIYTRCKMTDIEPVMHRGVQVAHFRALNGISIDELLNRSQSEKV